MNNYYIKYTKWYKTKELFEETTTDAVDFGYISVDGTEKKYKDYDEMMKSDNSKVKYFDSWNEAKEYLLNHYNVNNSWYEILPNTKKAEKELNGKCNLRDEEKYPYLINHIDYYIYSAKNRHDFIINEYPVNPESSKYLANGKCKDTECFPFCNFNKKYCHYLRGVRFEIVDKRNIKVIFNKELLEYER